MEVLYASSLLSFEFNLTLLITFSGESLEMTCRLYCFTLSEMNLCPLKPVLCKSILRLKLILVLILTDFWVVVCILPYFKYCVSGPWISRFGVELGIAQVLFESFCKIGMKLVIFNVLGAMYFRSLGSIICFYNSFKYVLLSLYGF